MHASGLVDMLHAYRNNDGILIRKLAKKGFIDEEHVSNMKDIENLRV